MPKLTMNEYIKALDRLENTVTVFEVAKMYGLSKSGVQYHIDEGNIAAVNTLSGIMLLDIRSVIQGMGIPPYPGRACRDINWRQVDGQNEGEEFKGNVWWSG